MAAKVRNWFTRFGGSTALMRSIRHRDHDGEWQSDLRVLRSEIETHYIEAYQATEARLIEIERVLYPQLKTIVDAIGTNDTEKAIEVWRSDQRGDDIYNAIFRELMTYMMEDPRAISRVLNIIWALRSLERIGDHARNIAELVIYLVRGTDVRHIGLTRMKEEVENNRGE